MIIMEISYQEEKTMTSKYMLLSETRGVGEFRKLSAEVLRSCQRGQNAQFGIRMMYDNISLGIEWYEGKNELFAEDAAENYILGIKKYIRD